MIGIENYRMSIGSFLHQGKFKIKRSQMTATKVGNGKISVLKLKLEKLLTFYFMIILVAYVDMCNINLARGRVKNVTLRERLNNMENVIVSKSEGIHEYEYTYVYLHMHMYIQCGGFRLRYIYYSNKHKTYTSTNSMGNFRHRKEGMTWMKPKKEINKIEHIKNGNKRQGLTMMHWNMGSTNLQNKMRELERVIQERKPGIIGISEANLKQTVEMDKVRIPGYEIYTSYTAEGGVMRRLVTYVREGVNVKLREDLMDTNFSSIWLEINLKQGKKDVKILVCNFYREHKVVGIDKTDQREEQWMRWSIFLEQWTRALECHEEIHVMGDANFNWKLIDRNQGTTNTGIAEATKDIILTQGVTQCIKEVTRHPQGGQKHEPAILDHFYTTAPDKLKKIEVIQTGYSDHSIIMGQRETSDKGEQPKYTQKRSYKKFTNHEYLSELRKIKWLNLYLCEDVNEAVEIFTNNIAGILDREDMAPVKMIQNRKNYCPWISEDTKALMRERDEAVKMYNEYRSKEYEMEAKRLRKQVTKTLKEEKSTNGRNKIKELEKEKDIGKIWTTLGSYLNWNKQALSPIQLINKEGKIVTSPAKMAKLQNEFYIDKVKKIRQMLPTGGDPCTVLRSMMRNRQRPDITPNLKFKAVGPEEVEKIIKDLKNSKASGVDWIDTAILKLSKDTILPALTHIINLSLTTNTFPEQWKTAKIIPLWKGKDSAKTAPKNYRPVAILPIASKVLERVMHEQILNHMKENQFWHPNHHAYRKSRNTESAVIQMYDTWVQAIAEGKLASAAMIDMSAAFDTVDIEILLSKCELYNFGEEATNLLQSYLKDRRQLVSIGGHNSEPLQLEAGVPQGSILGPILYTLYTNDFPEVIHEPECTEGQEEGGSIRFKTTCNICGAIVCFADDSTYTVISGNSDTLTNNLTEKFRKMADYLGSQRLSVNQDKTHLLLLTTWQKRRNVIGRVTITTEEEVIEPTDREKLLGIELEENMGFGSHIDNITEKIKTGIKALKSIARISNFETRKNLMNGLITSRLIYMIGLWGGTAAYRLDTLQKLQTEALRLVTQRKWEIVGTKLISTRELLIQTGQLSVRQLQAYHTLTQVKKILINREPEYLYRKMTEENKPQRYETRGNKRADLKVKETNSSLAKTSFRWRGAELYNRLPVELRNESLNIYKKKVKEWVKTNIKI